MQIDSVTVLVFGLFIKLVLGGLFLVFWLKDRRAVWYAWWSAALLIGCITSALYAARGGAADYVAVVFGNACLILAFGCCWQSARVFDRRRPLWLPLLGAPVLWLVACLTTSLFDSVPSRIVLTALLISPLLSLTAFEFWRGRSERLPSRWAVIVLFLTLALFFAARVPMIGVLPFPFGAEPMQPGWLGAFNLVMFSHTVLLSVLLVSMSKERLELDQRTKAQTDPLTGALNRRALLARGARLLQRHRHARAQLCLLFLDLDEFKSLNDRFGHSGGDDVLTAFVAVVNDNIRPTDFLFRVGGEEFCCVLPHTGTAQAHRVAERIRHRFETTTVDVVGTPVCATVSVGIASTTAFGYDLDTLMRRADMAVYAAKRQGRNRVVVATPDIVTASDTAEAVTAAGSA